MTEEEFREHMQERGYGGAEVKEYGPERDDPMHTHEVSIMAFVLSGEITLELEDGSTTYGPGDWCELAANTLHTEHIGANGARVLLAYK